MSELSPYLDIDCCEHTRGTDTLMNRYRMDTEHVMNLLSTHPDQLSEILWTKFSPLCVDRDVNIKWDSEHFLRKLLCVHNAETCLDWLIFENILLDIHFRLRQACLQVNLLTLIDLTLAS